MDTDDAQYLIRPLTGSATTASDGVHKVHRLRRAAPCKALKKHSHLTVDPLFGEAAKCHIPSRGFRRRFSFARARFPPPPRLRLTYGFVYLPGSEASSDRFVDAQRGPRRRRTTGDARHRRIGSRRRSRSRRLLRESHRDVSTYDYERRKWPLICTNSLCTRRRRTPTPLKSLCFCFCGRCSLFVDAFLRTRARVFFWGGPSRLT